MTMKRTLLVQILVLLAVYLFRWQLLQVVAWISMFARYGSEHGLVQGWRMTFSGDYPCAICRAVAEADGALWPILATTPSLLLIPASFVALAALVLRFRARMDDCLRANPESA